MTTDPTPTPVAPIFSDSGPQPGDSTHALSLSGLPPYPGGSTILTGEEVTVTGTLATPEPAAPYRNGDHDTRNGPLHIANRADDMGRPAGGAARAVGLKIDFQDGPLGRDADRVTPNGAFVETLIEVARARLAFYQESPFACDENHVALILLDRAVHVLNSRTARREAAGVEGTHEGN